MDNFLYLIPIGVSKEFITNFKKYFSLLIVFCHIVVYLALITHLKLSKMTSTLTQIKNYILDATDGPVSKFILIYRSLQLVAHDKSNYIDVANVLSDCLIDFETIPSNEFSHSI